MNKSRVEYLVNYTKNNIKRFELKLSRKNDAAIIEHLSKKPNVNQYLKQLIEKDIKKGTD